MVKDHTKLIREETCCRHSTTKKQKGIFYMHSPIERTVHTIGFCIPDQGTGLDRKKTNESTKAGDMHERTPPTTSETVSAVETMSYFFQSKPDVGMLVFDSIADMQVMKTSL